MPNDTLTQEQIDFHVKNAKANLEDAAMFERLAAYGLVPQSAKEAEEYIALGDQLLEIDEKRAMERVSPVSAALARLNKTASSKEDQAKLDDAIRKVAAHQITRVEGLAESLAALI